MYSSKVDIMTDGDLWGNDNEGDLWDDLDLDDIDDDWDDGLEDISCRAHAHGTLHGCGGV